MHASSVGLKDGNAHLCFHICRQRARVVRLLPWTFLAGMSFTSVIFAVRSVRGSLRPPQLCRSCLLEVPCRSCSFAAASICLEQSLCEGAGNYGGWRTVGPPLQKSRDGDGKGGLLSLQVRSFRKLSHGRVRDTIIMSDLKRFVGNPAEEKNVRDGVSMRLLQLVNGMSASDVAYIFHCCKKGNYIHGDLFNELANKMLVTKPMLYDFTNVQLSNVVSALGVLRRNHAKEWAEDCPGVDAVVDDLLDQCQKRLKSKTHAFSASSIYDLLHGIGCLYRVKGGLTKTKETMTLVGGLVETLFAGDHVSKCLPEEFVKMLVGCATMGYQDAGSLAKLYGALESKLSKCASSGDDVMDHEDFRCQDLVPLVWAYEKLGIRDAGVEKAMGGVFLKKLERFKARELADILYGLVQFGFDDKDVVNAMILRISTDKKLAKLKSAYLLNVACAVVQSGCADEWVWNSISKEIVRESRISGWKERHLAEIVALFATAGLQNSEFWNALGQEIAKGERRALYKERDLVDILYGLAKSGVHDMAVIGVLSKEMIDPPRLRKYRERELVEMVESLARVGYKDRNVLGVLGGELAKEGRLEEFKEKHLATILLGLGQLGFWDEKTMAGVVGEIMRSTRLVRFKEHHLVDIVNGFGLLKWKESSLLSPLVAEICKGGRLRKLRDQEMSAIVNGFGGLGLGGADGVDALASEVVKPERMSAYGLQDLCDVARGLGKLGHDDDGDWGALSAKICERQNLSQFTGQQLAVILEAFGHARCFEEAVLVSVISRIYGLKSQLDGETLASIMRSLAMVKPGVSWTFALNRMGPWIGALSEELCTPSRMNSLSTENCSELCCALSSLQYYDPILTDCLVERLVSLGGRVSPSAVLPALEVCANFDHQSAMLKEVVEDWARNFWDLEGIVGFVYYLGVLGWLTPKLFETMCIRIVDMDIEPLECERLLQGWLAVRDCFEPKEPVTSILNVAKRKHELGVGRTIRFREHELHQALQAMGVQCESPFRIADGSFFLSLMVEGDPGTALLQCDRGDYTINEAVGGGRRLLGGTKFLAHLIEKNGYKVLLVPYYLWERMDVIEQKEWLQNELELRKGESYCETEQVI